VEDKTVEPASGTAILPNGIKLPYVEQGDPDGKAVLFLHGFAGSCHSFDQVLPLLPDSIHAFAYSQRGHGDASQPQKGYRLQDFASDARGFLNKFELQRAVLVGHSMGAAVAMKFALNFPGLTVGLVLAGSGLPKRDDRAVQDFWESTVSRLEDPVDPGFVRRFVENTIGRPIPSDIFEKIVRDSLKVPAHVWKEAFKNRLKEDFTDEIGKIQAPTLLIWGDRDTKTSRSEQEALLTGIPDARLLVYQGTGHELHVEEPERFASDLVQFLENIPGSP
jgi:non-heme chloroperoxidase